MLQTTFQYYKNDVQKPEPQGYVTLERFLNGIKKPSKKNVELLEKIQKARESGDNKLKDELKKGLNGFTPAVHVTKGRKYEYVKSYTGLAVIDFDKLEKPEKLKAWLFNAYSSIVASWISPSKKGIKAIIRIPIAESKQEYKSFTFGICAEFYDIFEGFDYVINNAVLLTFIGHDPNILIRKNASIWTKQGIQVDSFESKEKTKMPTNHLQKVTDKQKEWVINWYMNAINSINTNGHPQLRDYSVSLGGYVGGGYLSQLEAEELASNMVRSNGYLQKGISGYIKTAKQAIDLGRNKPLIFK